MGPVVQIVGALLVLAGFALAQWGVLDGRSVRYLLLNLVGSAVLAVDRLDRGAVGVPAARGGVGGRLRGQPRRRPHDPPHSAEGALLTAERALVVRGRCWVRTNVG